MKFKLDENVTNEGLEAFAEFGFEAMTAAQQGMSGWPDERLRAACFDEGRIVLTADLDLTDIRDLPDGAPGIVVLRLPQQSRRRQAEAIRRLASALKSGLQIAGTLAIVESARVRVRRPG